MHSRGKARTKIASEYGRVMTNDGHLGGPAVERDLGLAEVDLGLAGRVGQRDEDLGGRGRPGGGRPP